MGLDIKAPPQVEADTEIFDRAGRIDHRFDSV